MNLAEIILWADREVAQAQTAARGGSRGFFVVLAIIGLVLMAGLLGYTGRDDTHITYYVADMIAAGEGLLNYNGERVEQSSTLLFTYVLALIVKYTGFSAAVIGPFVSGGFLLCILAAVVLVARKRAWNGGVVVATLATPLVYWSLSGMEVSFYTLLLFALVTAYAGASERPSVPRLGLLLLLGAGLTLTRPEAPFVIVLWLGVLLLAAWPRPRFASAGAVIAGVGLAIICRLAIGLQLFPLPVYAKQTYEGLGARVLASLGYLLETFLTVPLSLSAFGVALAFASLVLLRDRGRTLSWGWGAYTMALAVLAFSFASGGDWMEAGRFLVPAFLLVFMVALRLLGPRLRARAVIVLSAAFGGDAIWLATKHLGGFPLPFPARYEARNFAPAAVEQWNLPHARDLSFIDKAIAVLEADPREQVVVGSIQGGVVLYYLSHTLPGKIHFVDFHGITSASLRDCRGTDGWPYEPYEMLDELQTCTGLRFDYVFDLDPRSDWPRYSTLIENGCVEVVRDEPVLRSAPWSRERRWFQFMVRCD